jgi:hypothetical protein
VLVALPTLVIDPYLSAQNCLVNEAIAGLVATANTYLDEKYQPWLRLYNLTFLVGLASSVSLFWILNLLFPVLGLGEEVPFVGDEFVMGVDFPDASSEANTESGKMKAVAGSFHEVC